jgi:hypothetical protein
MGNQMHHLSYSYILHRILNWDDGSGRSFELANGSATTTVGC